MLKKLNLLLSVLIFLLVLFACESTLPTTEHAVPRYENVALKAGNAEGSIQLSVSSPSQQATIYYLITEQDALHPTADEVKAGVNYRSQEVLRAGSATNRLFITLTGFESETTYLVHTVLFENDLFSEVLSRKVRTKNAFEAGLFGSGTEEDPFQIDSVFQLELIGTDEYGYTMDAHYIQTKDIDLTEGGYGEFGKSWVPIGKQNGMNRKFSGVYDGNGYTISNLYIVNNSGTEKWGLFQETNFDSIVRNVHLENVYVKVSGFRIAGLIGYAKGFVYNVSVKNAHVEQTAGEGQVALIIGAFYDTGTLFRAEAEGNVIATGRRVGGVVGAATTNSGYDAVRITDVSFQGSITGFDATARQYGGILGAGTGTIVARTFVDATIVAVRQVGGIVGYMEGMGSITGSVSDSIYAGQSIEANGLDGNATVGIGKILGDASITKGPYEVINSFSNQDAVILTVGNNSSRHSHGNQVAITEFMLQTFYQNFLSAWNMSNTWLLVENQYPKLRFNRP